MKKLYVIIPLILLVAFSAYYMKFSAHHAVIEAEREAAAEVTKAEEEARSKAAEKNAREESERRAAEREAEAAAKEATRRQQWEEAGAAVASQIAEYRAQGDTYSKRVNELELQIVELRRQKDQKTNELLALAEQMELANIAKRNAELEVQRLTDMVANRLAQSSLTRMPPPPPPPAPAR